MADQPKKPWEIYTFRGTEREVHDPERLERALRQWGRWLAEKALEQHICKVAGKKQEAS